MVPVWSAELLPVALLFSSLLERVFRALATAQKQVFFSYVFYFSAYFFLLFLYNLWDCRIASIAGSCIINCLWCPHLRATLNKSVYWKTKHTVHSVDTFIQKSWHQNTLFIFLIYICDLTVHNSSVKNWTVIVHKNVPNNNLSVNKTFLVDANFFNNR